jgi:hypothetical protein
VNWRYTLIFRLAQFRFDSMHLLFHMVTLSAAPPRLWPTCGYGRFKQYYSKLSDSPCSSVHQALRFFLCTFRCASTGLALLSTPHWKFPLRLSAIKLLVVSYAEHNRFPCILISNSTSRRTHSFSWTMATYTHRYQAGALAVACSPYI